jgi:hypothetical protein
MRIGITVRFQNSYFSGSIPQVACALARSCMEAGHETTLIYPKGESDWFLEIQEYQSHLPPRREWTGGEQFDAVIEVVWAFKPDERSKVAPRRISLAHYPSVFYDMESSVYHWNGAERSFRA